MRVDVSDVTGCSCVPCMLQPWFLQPLHGPDAFPKLSKPCRDLALPAQTSHRGADSDGKGACRRLGQETAVGRCRPPDFWQESQILDGYFEVLVPIQEWWSQLSLSGALRNSICLLALGMLRPRTTSSLLLSSLTHLHPTLHPTPHSHGFYLGSLVSGLQWLEQGELTRTGRNSKRESLALTLLLRGEACKAHGDAYV